VAIQLCRPRAEDGYEKKMNVSTDPKGIPSLLIMAQFLPYHPHLNFRGISWVVDRLVRNGRCNSSLGWRRLHELSKKNMLDRWI
jgi:hypothetical protein